MREERKREIRIKADGFRETCKMGSYGIEDLFEECERAGYKLIRYPLGEEADLGFAMKRDRDTIIFTNTSIRLAREIFTLAHEIGHALLHLEKTSTFIDDNGTISGKSSDEKEQEANYFAASLLMPRNEVEKFFDLELPDFKQNGLSSTDIARIMSQFNVSFEMTLNRLESLGKIDTNEKIRLDNEKNEKRVGNLLRSVKGNAKLNMACEDIKIPYEYLEYAIFNYNHNTIPEETLERILACYRLTLEDVSDRLVLHTEKGDDLDDLIGGLTD